MCQLESCPAVPSEKDVVDSVALEEVIGEVLTEQVKQ